MDGVSNPIGDGETDRWVAVGRSHARDAATAGREALTQALAGRGDARLLVVFADHDYDLQTLVGTIHEASGGVELIGCSTAGEIGSDGSSDDSLVIIAFGGSFSVVTEAAEDASRDMREAGRRVANAAHLVETRPHTVLLTFTDTLAGDQQQVLRGIYHELGAGVPVVGGCAGDKLKMSRTYQFHNGRLLTDAVVAAAVGSDAPFGVGVRHGWETIGTPMTVTASEGTIIHELDAQPALDVYLSRFNLSRELTDDAAQFTRFAMRHPLALARRAGEPLVRFITGACPKIGSLKTLAAVPEGAHVWLMTGDDDSVLAATDAACNEAFAGIDGAPKGVMVFDCVTRRDMLGSVGIQREIDRIAAQSEGAPIAGLFTYGEIARTRGVNGLHHETLVVLAIG